MRKVYYEIFLKVVQIEGEKGVEAGRFIENG